MPVQLVYNSKTGIRIISSLRVYNQRIFIYKKKKKGLMSDDVDDTRVVYIVISSFFPAFINMPSANYKMD